MKDLKPFGINLLVKPLEQKQVLINQAPTLCEYGEVLSVGDEVQKIKVGDMIAFTKWGVKHIEIDDKKYHFVPEDGRFILGTFSMFG